MFAFRPGLSRKSPRTPVEGLYLAGPSSAAGPLGTCIAGAIAAEALLADLRAREAQMSGRYDAAVIGGGVSGLAAAALLAKAGLRTVLLEQDATLTGPAGEAALRALDPRLANDLKLAKRGLKFSSREFALAVPRPGGQPALVSRDRHATARSLAALSPADAAAFAAWRHELYALARARCAQAGGMVLRWPRPLPGSSPRSATSWSASVSPAPPASSRRRSNPTR